MIKNIQKFFTPQEIAEISLNFVNSVQTDEKTQKINTEKLLLLKFLTDDGIINSGNFIKSRDL